MAHEKQVDLPDDLEVLLRRAMSVEPSAGFLPRVRERIATAEPRGFLFPWRIAIAAGAVAVALLVAVWPALRPTPAVAPPAPQGSVARSAEPVSPPTVPAPEPREIPGGVPAPRPRRPPAMAAADTVRAPLVIVDLRQRAALSAFMRLIGEGSLTDEAFAGTTPQSMDAIREQVVPLSVGAVEVNPIAVGGVLPSGPDRN
ncbi:MAG TPA: hypothetical protein VJ813_09340 [Vicinamibacterales bacterium]|nr:hypothetical protein [Vicinamibacterales bacterium]